MDGLMIMEVKNFIEYYLGFDKLIFYMMYLVS